MIATTRVLVKLRLSYGTISQERCIVTYLMVNFIFNWIIHLIVRILGSILNPQGFFDSWWNIHKAFWHLKVSQPLRYFWVNLVFVSSSQWIFISSRSVSLMPPRWRNSSQVSFPPENICIFPDESSSPRWGTETGRFKLISFVTKKIVPYSRTSYKYSKP